MLDPPGPPIGIVAPPFEHQPQAGDVAAGTVDVADLEAAGLVSAPWLVAVHGNGGPARQPVPAVFPGPPVETVDKVVALSERRAEIERVLRFAVLGGSHDTDVLMEAV